MCRTVHALLQTIICGIQMLVRVFMTLILMLENLIRMILQTLYNFISFMMQMLSLIPICFVFLLTSRLKCFMCGGGGPCPVNRGGACDCLMSAVAIVILFFIFRATGVLDKIFYSLGYARAVTVAQDMFIPTPGSDTECTRDGEGTTDFTLPPDFAKHTMEKEHEEKEKKLIYDKTPPRLRSGGIYLPTVSTDIEILTITDGTPAVGVETFIVSFHNYETLTTSVTDEDIYGETETVQPSLTNTETETVQPILTSTKTETEQPSLTRTKTENEQPSLTRTKTETVQPILTSTKTFEDVTETITETLNTLSAYYLV